MNISKLLPWLAIGGVLWYLNKNGMIPGPQPVAPGQQTPGPTDPVQDAMSGFSVSWR